MNEINVLVKDTQERAPRLLSTMGEYNKKPATWKRAPISPDHAGTLISDFQTPEL